MRNYNIEVIVLVLFLLTSPCASGVLFAADLGAARNDFDTHCAKCHGEDGRGDGPAGAALPTKPRNFSDCTRMAKESDQMLFKTIKGGGSSVGLSKEMPPWGEAFEDKEIKGLVAYVRQFCHSPRAMNK
jgi:mono/diheme cytochrome c family protein